MPTSIRLATQSDLESINTIYNHFVRTCTCTYQDTPETMPDRTAWFAAHDALHPVVAAEVDGTIAGWGAVSVFHERGGFRHTVEDSIYVSPAFQGKGIGRLILTDLIDRATHAGHRQIVSAIDSLQGASIALHLKYGFTHAGRLNGVGTKFGKSLDLVYVQKSLGR